VFFLRMYRLSEASGLEDMETTMVSYARLDNRVLSGISSLLQPLIRGTVTRKLAKGVETVNQLSRMMRREPDRVMFEALDPPPFRDDEVVLLRQTLATVRHPTAIDRLSAAP